MHRYFLSLAFVLALSSPNCGPHHQSNPEALSVESQPSQTYSVGEYEVPEGDGSVQVLLVAPANKGRGLRVGRVLTGQISVTVTGGQACSEWQAYVPSPGVRQVVFVGASSPSAAVELDPSRSDKHTVMYRYCPVPGDFNFSSLSVRSSTPR